MNNQINNPINNISCAQMQNSTPNPYLANYAPMGAQTPFYSQPILQPAGMVYLINSGQELSTIPTSAGLALYWCSPENKVYIRNYINGMVETKEFFLSTSQNSNSSNGANNFTQIAGMDAIEDIPTELFDKLNGRLSSIESQLKKIVKGGEPEWTL
jgi:hypothetical protein